ncbi:MAG: hypothetical protein U0694_16485 [Anaerolineae bacterium]
MPIQVSWGTPEKNVILCEFNGIWSLTDYHNMIDEMHVLMTSVDHTVHSISDFTNNSVSPAQLFSTGRHVDSRKTVNTGINVMVKANPFLKALTPMYSKMFLKDIKVYFTDTLAEAFQMIQTHEQAKTNK